MPASDGSTASQLRHDAVFWRRLAQIGASRGPRWWLRYSPPFFGLAAAALVPSARRAVNDGLVQMRGDVGALRGALDVARTFMTYAGCLAEGLAAGSKNAGDPEAIVHGDLNLSRVLAEKRGAIFVTAHTAGWEIVGPLLGRDHDLRVMMAMHGERDHAANALHDAARAASGLQIARVGDDPLASLALLHHVRGGGVAALQIDRVVIGQRTREVELFGARAQIPEGPLKLAQLTGAPVLPVFCARLGFRKYVIDIGAPIDVPKKAAPDELDRAAQRVADAMAAFVRRHPTQWFRFAQAHAQVR